MLRWQCELTHLSLSSGIESVERDLIDLFDVLDSVEVLEMKIFLKAIWNLEMPSLGHSIQLTIVQLPPAVS